MGEGRNLFLPSVDKFRRHTSVNQGLVGEATESHKVESRDGVPFDEFKNKQHNHAGQPGMLYESPSTPHICCHPCTRDEEDDGTGHHDTIVEDCNVADGLTEEFEVAHCPRSEI